MRDLVEFRDEELGTDGEPKFARSTSPSGASRSARRSKPPASRSARASRAPSSGTTSAAVRSPTVRTTCAPRARSAPAPCPPASSRGCACRVRWATSAGPRRVWRSPTIDAERNLLLIKGSVPGARNSILEIRRRDAKAPKVPVLGKTDQSRRTGRAVHRAFPPVAGPRDRPRRRRRASPGHRLDPDPRRGLDDHRQGVASEGHRSCPCRRAQRAQPLRRRCRLRPEAASLHGQGQPQSPPQGDALGPLGSRRAWFGRRRRRRGLRDAFDQERRRGARQVGRQAPDPGRSSPARRPAR